MNVFHEEIQAIEGCQNVILKKDYQKFDKSFRSENQVAFKALNFYVIDWKLIWECRSILNEAGKYNEDSSIWIWIVEYERANKALLLV